MSSARSFDFGSNSRTIRFPLTLVWRPPMLRTRWQPHNLSRMLGMPSRQPRSANHPKHLWRNPEPKRAYDVVIIGGGGHGLATAYYLAKRHGITNVAVLERGWLAAATSRETPPSSARTTCGTSRLQSMSTP